MSKNKQVAIKDEKIALPAELLEDLIADSGAGLEEMKASDMTTPFIRIVQALSPELDESKANYIAGAKKGSLFNTVTREVFEEITVIPCFYQTQFVEWRPRDSGGGFVAVHTDESILDGTKKVDNKDINSEGNEIVRTAMYYCLRVINAEEFDFEPVAIPMQKTQLKKARNLNSIVQRNTIRDPKTGKIYVQPLFSQVFKFKSITESNKKGQSYSNWTFEKIAKTFEFENGTSFYQAAKTFCEGIKAGSVKVDGYANEEDIGSVDIAAVM
jgi:hypothetical protein